MDNSIEKINKHSSFGKGLENGELFFKGKAGDIHITKGDEDWNSEEEGVRVTLQPLTDEWNRNIADAAMIDTIKEWKINPAPEMIVGHPPAERINYPNVGTPGHIDHGLQNLDTSSLLQSPPEDIEYEFDDWKKARPMLWNTDAKNGGKKRDKAKAKAQKKARKIARR